MSFNCQRNFNFLIFYLFSIIYLVKSATISGKKHVNGIEFFDHEFTGNAITEYDPENSAIADSDEMGVDDPETMPRLFQGDIAVDPFTFVSLRLGVNPQKNPKRLWPNGTIPFKISHKYNGKEREAIIHTIQTFNIMTCINFVDYDGEDEDYIYIMPPTENPKGCWSYVGKKGGRQVVALQQPDETSMHCFNSEGRIMHELMHSMGIYHEQSRADRDEYIKIHWENISPKFHKNFKLLSKKKARYVFDYDYNSVMHYGEYYFSKKKGEKKSITALTPGVHIGQRKTMSKTDCLKINEMYGCLTGRHAKMYKSFCHLLAL